MRFSNFAFVLTLSALSVATSGQVEATSIVSLRPHDPARACPAIEAAVAEMTGQKPRAEPWPIYYSEKFGIVEYDEQADFIKSMTSSKGRLDKSPVQLTFVWPVGKRKDNNTRALYVIGLERDQWHNERESSFDLMQIEPEGFELTPSYWLVEFSENRIVTMRQGFIFFDFIDYNKRLKGCGRYGR
jgi:hypothetical protein